MIASYSNEVDYLTEMLSFNIKELIILKNRFVETDSKFKEYVKKSDIYIKDKETKLAEVQKEVQEMSYRYQNHGEIFRQEKERADKNQKLYEDLLLPYEDVKKEASPSKRARGANALSAVLQHVKIQEERYIHDVDDR